MPHLIGVAVGAFAYSAALKAVVSVPTLLVLRVGPEADTAVLKRPQRLAFQHVQLDAPRHIHSKITLGTTTWRAYLGGTFC